MPRLRREFAKRSPEESELLGNDKLEPGEEGGPIIWESLQVLDKVRSSLDLMSWKLTIMTGPYFAFTLPMVLFGCRQVSELGR